MAKQHKNYPPIQNKRARFRGHLLRWTANLFTMVSLTVLYYVAFSFFFDTPAEYRIKQQTAMLKKEYRELEKRMGEIDDVLDNVVERDKNVFNILFEAEPYEFSNRYETSRWSALEALGSKTNRELEAMLAEKSARLEHSLNRSAVVYTTIFDTADSMGVAINNIPSIQPVINNELKLLTASFGMRIHPFYKMLSQHNGVDFTVPEGSRVFATADGMVKETILRRSSTGLTVVIDHGNGYETYYSHLGEVLVKKGQKINRGDIIAFTGNSGLSLVPHLHYEVRHNGEAADPIHYFFLELSPRQYQQIQRIARSGMQSFD